MANTINIDAPRGFRPVGNIAAVPFNGGTVRCQIPASDTIPTFIGDFVSLLGSASADGYPTVNQTIPGERIYGVVVSFDADPDTALNTIYRLASTQRYCQVVAATENQLFVGQSAGLPGVAAIGLHADIVVAAGNTTYGISAMEISGTTIVTSAQLRLIAHVNRADNDPTLANPELIVQVAEPQLGAGLLAVGV